MSFEPIHTSTLADGVENSLIRFISHQTMQPGDLLPREEEIAEALNVSRLSVREGIGRLKALGLIEPRKRRGTVLRKPDPFLAFSKIASANLFTSEDYLDFMEMRIALELGMCEWIYIRKTEEQIDRLREIAMGIDDVESEKEFHTYLMQIAGNCGVEEFRTIIAEFFKYPKEHDQDFWERTREEHLELCDVLEHGSAIDFYTAMRKHFQPYFNKIRLLNKQNMEDHR